MDLSVKLQHNWNSQNEDFPDNGGQSTTKVTEMINFLS